DQPQTRFIERSAAPMTPVSTRRRALTTDFSDEAVGRFAVVSTGLSLGTRSVMLFIVDFLGPAGQIGASNELVVFIHEYRQRPLPEINVTHQAVSNQIKRPNEVWTFNCVDERVDRGKLPVFAPEVGIRIHLNRFLQEPSAFEDAVAGRSVDATHRP